LESPWAGLRDVRNVWVNKTDQSV